MRPSSAWRPGRGSGLLAAGSGIRPSGGLYQSFSGPFVLGKIFIGTDEAEDLSARSLKIQMRVRYIDDSNTRIDNLTTHFRDIV